MRHRSFRLLAVLLPLAAAGCGAVISPVPMPPAIPIPQVANIPIGKAPIILGIAPDGGQVYATSNDGNFVIIDAATNKSIKRLDISPYSVAMAVTPDGSKVLVSNLFGGALSVVDTATLSNAPAMPLVSDLRRGGYGRIAITPDGTTAFVVNQQTSQLVILDLKSGATDSRMLDIRPTEITLTPDGQRGLVCGCRPVCAPGMCKMFFPAERSFGNYIQVAAEPFRAAIDPSGKNAYVTSMGAPGLSVVDLGSQQDIADIRGPIQPTGVAVSPDGALVYVTSQTMGTVTVVDAASNTIRAVGKIGSYVREIVLSPDGKRAYVSTSDGVAVVDTASFTGP